jgi:hypothetical protein
MTGEAEMERAEPAGMPAAAKIFIGLVGLTGLTGIAATLHGWTPELEPRFAAYLIVALISSGMKVALPGVNGTISLNFVLIMLGIAELRPQEALLLAIASAIVQNCWKRKGGVKPVHVFFNTTSLALALLTAFTVYHQRWSWITKEPEEEFVRLTLAGIVYFLVNVGNLGIVVALSERRRARVLRLDLMLLPGRRLVGRDSASRIGLVGLDLHPGVVAARLPDLSLRWPALRQAGAGKIARRKSGLAASAHH